MNFRQIAKILGALALLESVFLLLCYFAAIYFSEKEQTYFLISFVFALVAGAGGVIYGNSFRPFNPSSNNFGKREGTIIVVSTWIVFSFLGMMPYWLSGNIPSFTNAFFETISGFTTTGSSILTDVEIMPQSILLWRSLTHWIGGLGIIVISLAILPIFGFQGTQLFSAEATGVTKEKIAPKISGTAKRLFAIYIGFTIAQTVLMCCCGMSLFDALCNSFSTVSTGGFSTKNDSIAYWQSPGIEWIVTAFMMLSGINFSLFYFLIKGNFKKFFRDEEMRTYIAILVAATIIVCAWSIPSSASLPDTLRNSLFTVTSLLTTTGFYSVDYSTWEALAFVLLLLTIVGGSASSTSGGLKVIRVLLVFKYCYYEFKRIMHPHAVFPVRYNGKGVKDQTITRMLAYVLGFVIILLIGSAILCLSGLAFDESINAMLSSLTNTGINAGFVETRHAVSLSAIPEFSKCFLCLVMLVGRLELFTVLLIFTPEFWKK
ncbi:MAG: TrkH family potassium uptake protein [Paludibacter sp.]|jgi:trk system potassium uptake protein TrkH|nr:TrkH family potassium uptake protein [Paludibacter sp.]